MSSSRLPDVVAAIFPSPTLSQEESLSVTARYLSFETQHKGGQKRLAYIEWKHQTVPHKKTVVIVHGLTRNCRDYDALAQHLVVRCNYRCLCVDVAGRGYSDRLEAEEYGYATYVSDFSLFLNHLEDDFVDFVGTSMGGLIGMFLSGAESKIRKLVMVDIGTFISKKSLAHIGSYVGEKKVWGSLDEAEAHFMTLYGGEKYFGANEQEIAHYALHSTRSVDQNGEQVLVLHYDLAIAPAITAVKEDVNMSAAWNLLEVKSVLIVRGENSELLTKETAASMMSTKEGVKEVVIPHCGHAPTLMRESQITLIEQFLSSD